MAVILSRFLALLYIFSGLICWLAFLRHFNQLSGWQRLLAVLASFVIWVFWPIWIIIEIMKAEQLKPRVAIASIRRLRLIFLGFTEKSDSR